MARSLLQPWSFTMDPNPRNNEPDTPVVLLPDAGLVLATDGLVLYALRMDSGALAWRSGAYAGISAFSVQGGTVFVSDGALLRALNAADGSTLWEYEARGMTSDYYGPPLATARFVFVAEMLTGAVHAVRRDNGRELWVRRNSNAVSSPLVANDRFVFYAAEASVKALDALTGNLAWTWVPDAPDDPEYRMPRNFLHLMPGDFITPAGFLVVTYAGRYPINPVTGQDDPRAFQRADQEVTAPTRVIAEPAYGGRMAFGYSNGHVAVIDIMIDLPWWGCYPGMHGQPISGTSVGQLAFAGPSALLVTQVHADTRDTDFVLLGLDHGDTTFQDLSACTAFSSSLTSIAPPAVANGTVYALMLPPDALDPKPGKPTPPSAVLQATPLVP